MRTERVTPSDQFAKSMWILASIAVVVAALYLAKGLLIPLTLACLLSFLLAPVCGWIERHGLGRIPAVLVTAVVAFALLGGVLYTTVTQLNQVAHKLPEYRENLEAKIASIDHYLMAPLRRVTKSAEQIGKNIPTVEVVEAPAGTADSPYSVRVLSSPASPLQVLRTTFGTLFEALGLCGLVIILVVFVLFSREDLRDRFIRLLGEGKLTVTTQLMADAAERVSRYLSMLFVVNASYGITVCIGLYLIGIPNALLWGILAGTLRFIPYIGPWVAAGMPIGLSLILSNDWSTPGLVIGFFVILELLSNNVMEPWLYGKNTGMSSVAILVAAAFWTWLWGITGLLMSTPLTVCIFVIGKHVPQLAFLEILLGDEPVLEPQRRIYQRLLSEDQEEAEDILEEELKNKPLSEVYDSLLIPALALAETDWHRGALDEEKHRFILESLKEIIHERDSDGAEAVDAEKNQDVNSPKPFVLCLPARDEADEIATMMLAQLLEKDDCVVHSVPLTALSGQLVELAAHRKPDVVCISATPPAAVMHARHLCKIIRGRFPDLPVVVGLWSAPGDLDKEKKRLASGETMTIVSKLADAEEQVRHLTQPESRYSELQVRGNFPSQPIEVPKFLSPS